MPGSLTTWRLFNPRRKSPELNWTTSTAFFRITWPSSSWLVLLDWLLKTGNGLSRLRTRGKSGRMQILRCDSRHLTGPWYSRIASHVSQVDPENCEQLDVTG